MNKYGPILLLIFQIIAHMALICGLFTFGLYDWGIVLAIYFITGCVGMSVTYHRLLSHNSFTAPRWFEVIGTLAAAYGLTGSSIAWVNNHRAHHMYTDTKKDPHSPKFLGYFKVQWLSMFTSTKSLRYARRLRKDKFHVALHRYYFLFHFIILILLLAVFGLHVTCMVYLVPAAILWNAGSFINTACHSILGYKNYSINDTSKNNLILGIFMWGEGYHNNHHAYPNNAKYSHKWWELDISWAIIRLVSTTPTTLK